jgi:hypothetical protein
MNVLLDVDGVLIRDPKILDRTRDNIARYVREKVPRAKDPIKLRDYLYRTYGHTGRGLRKTLGVSTHDFDTQLYDKTMLEQLTEYLTTDTFQEDAGVVRYLLNHGHYVSLFSNAPGIWTWPIACAIDLRLDTSSFAGYKPEPIAYTHLRNRNPVIFVDDVRNNLLPIQNNPNWIPVHYKGDPAIDRIMTIQGLGELPGLIERVYTLWDKDGRLSDRTCRG